MLEFKNVSVVDSRDLKAGPCSLVVERGEVVCFCGDAFADDSLLLAVMGLWPLHGGYITVEGEPVVPGSATYFRQQMAYVPSRLPHDNLTVGGLCQQLWGLQTHGGHAADRAVLLTHWPALGLDASLLDRPTSQVDDATLQLALLAMVPLLGRPMVLIGQCPQSEAVSQLLRRIADDGAEVVYTCGECLMACDKMIALPDL